MRHIHADVDALRQLAQRWIYRGDGIVPCMRYYIGHMWKCTRKKERIILPELNFARLPTPTLTDILKMEEELMPTSAPKRKRLQLSLRHHLAHPEVTMTTMTARHRLTMTMLMNATMKKREGSSRGRKNWITDASPRVRL
jgi:hypothetical protein